MSASVRIAHTWIADLKVILSSPDGAQAVLHDRSGRSTGGIDRAYDSSGAGLSALAGNSTAGAWTLSVGDYAADDTGTIERWGIKLTYPHP